MKDVIAIFVAVLVEGSGEDFDDCIQVEGIAGDGITQVEIAVSPVSGDVFIDRDEGAGGALLFCLLFEFFKSTWVGRFCNDRGALDFYDQELTFRIYHSRCSIRLFNSAFSTNGDVTTYFGRGN